MNVGYFGVIMPQVHFWQGFYLTQYAIEQGREHVESFRRNAPVDETTVNRVFAPVRLEDQALFGTIVNSLAESATDTDGSYLTMYAGLLHALGAGKFFLIRSERASRDGCDGYLSSFQNMPETVTTIDAARTYIQGLPEVGRMARHLMRERQTSSH